jgi:DNA-binding NarL/FixJ family response regulator
LTKQRRITVPVPLLDHDPDPALALIRIPPPVREAPAAPFAATTPALAPPTTTVVVVDPHPPMREGLSLLLPPEGIAVSGGASTGAGGEALIARLEPDVALVAADLPDVDGIDLLRRLVRRGLRSAVVLYADDDDRERSAAAVHAGAAGVIAKRRTIAELAVALRSVATGGLWFDEPDDALAPAPAEPAPRSRLSARRRTAGLSSSELRVLALVADGGSTEATAEALSLSPHTVRTHMRNVMRKLAASRRAHAVAFAFRVSAIVVCAATRPKGRDRQRSGLALRLPAWP